MTQPAIHISSGGAEKAEEVAAHGITDVRVLFTPGRLFVQVLNTVQFQKETTNEVCCVALLQII